MAKGNQKASNKAAAKGARASQVSAEALPRRTLPEVVPVAAAIYKNYAGKAASWDDIATALGVSSRTSNTKYLIWSAEAYSLISKDESGQYALQEAGRKIVAPTYEGEDVEGRRKAVLTPTILSKFFTDYNGHPLPPENLFPNVLENKFGVPRDRTDEARATIVANGRYAELLHDSPDGEPIVVLSSAPAVSEPASLAFVGEPQAEDVKPQDAKGTAVDWSKVCFYITPIGDENTEVRRHSDMMLKHLVNPVLGSPEFQLVVVRADKIERSGLITQQILEHIVRSRICVVDLSFGNPNAFYELGVRHVCKLPTVQVIRKGDKIPFDVSQGRTIQVDTSDVYTIMDRFESARRELSEHVRQILSAKGKVDDNPIAVYLPDLQASL